MLTSVPQLIQTIFPCREWRGVVKFLANSGDLVGKGLEGCEIRKLKINNFACYLRDTADGIILVKFCVRYYVYSMSEARAMVILIFILLTRGMIITRFLSMRLMTPSTPAKCPCVTFTRCPGFAR